MTPERIELMRAWAHTANPNEVVVNTFAVLLNEAVDEIEKLQAWVDELYELAEAEGLEWHRLYR